ncbi:MAG: replication-associated recombination protein A [Spirochaetaceae bacterium]|nr:replication-associated recombination protein A [Spirochaetaceae bacterium]
MDLFDAAAEDRGDAGKPLAVRMRPRTLDEVVGQDHLLVAGSPLRRLVDGNGAGSPAGPSSLILWGPPGTGKTTLAYLVSSATGRSFTELSAVNAGVKDVRAVVESARRQSGMSGRETVLFIDEVHRFSKTQQDALLPAVENRWVTLIAATTENPYFSVVSPLLSRSLLLTLAPLEDGGVEEVVRRAATDERGLGGAVTVSDEAMSHLLRVAGGDARRALTALEAGAGAVLAVGGTELDVSTLEAAVDRAALRYDRDGDQHYDVISAFIKSVRGSDVDAALHYLARMIEAGEDPRFIARRLVILASEDIGLADPTSLLAAVAAAEAVALIGMPEGRINLAQAVIHLTLAPKSNAVIVAVDAALADVRAGLAGTVPPHLRDAHYGGAGKVGSGKGYVYPHDQPGAVVAQQYAPDVVLPRTYYRPTRYGAESRLGELWETLRTRIRGS